MQAIDNGQSKLQMHQKVFFPFYFQTNPLSHTPQINILVILFSVTHIKQNRGKMIKKKSKETTIKRNNYINKATLEHENQEEEKNVVLPLLLSSTRDPCL